MSETKHTIQSKQKPLKFGYEYVLKLKHFLKLKNHVNKYTSGSGYVLADVQNQLPN